MTIKELLEVHEKEKKWEHTTNSTDCTEFCRELIATYKQQMNELETQYVSKVIQWKLVLIYILLYMNS